MALTPIISFYNECKLTNSERRFERHWGLSVNSLVNFLHLFVLFRADFIDVQILTCHPFWQEIYCNAVGPGIVGLFELELLIISEVFNVLHI